MKNLLKILLSIAILFSVAPLSGTIPSTCESVCCQQVALNDDTSNEEIKKKKKKKKLKKEKGKKKKGKIYTKLFGSK